LDDLKPSQPSPPITSASSINTTTTTLRERKGTQYRHQSSPEFDHVRIENEMLLMTNDMRETAATIQSTIKKDLTVLANTAELQETNLSDTQDQNIKAKNVRVAKRLGFMITAIMILVSALIFLFLVPLIIVV